jgi:hypothetical protein
MAVLDRTRARDIAESMEAVASEVGYGVKFQLTPAGEYYATLDFADAVGGVPYNAQMTLRYPKTLDPKQVVVAVCALLNELNEKGQKAPRSLP